MNELDKLPTKLALIRDQLIDIAFGRKATLPDDDDIEVLVEWIYENASYEPEWGEYVTPGFDYYFSDEAIKDEEGKKVEINDELRIEFIREKLDSCFTDQQQAFTLKLNNEVNEEAYLGGSMLNMYQCGWSWSFYGCYKSIALFEKEIHADEFLFAYEMEGLSDEKLLAKWKIK